MLPDRVSNPGPLTYESGAQPIALRGPARQKEKLDKHIPTYNKNTGDKPSQQLLPKQVATQPSLLNQTNRISLPLLNCRPRPTSETFLISCPPPASQRSMNLKP